MRRNYGSLNLAALDLHQHIPVDASISSSSSSSSSSLALAHDLAHLHVDEYDDFDYDDSVTTSAKQPSSVGFPIELFAHLQNGGESDDDMASHILQLHDRANAPRRRKRSLSDHNGFGCETRRASEPNVSMTGISLTASSAATAIKTHKHQHTASIDRSMRRPIEPPPPDQSQQRHHMELHALRCLSLNLMLSSSVPNGSSGVSVTAPQPSTSVPKMSSFEIGCQPQTDRVTTALIAGRRGSLTRNMIQSV